MVERILIADDHGIVRLGLSLLINKLRPQAEIDEVDNYSGVMKRIDQKKYDLIILDINMPNGNFQDTLEVVKIKHPNVKILVFSSQDEHVYAIRYLKMGAHGFLHKFSTEEVIKKALEKMLDKGAYMSEEVLDDLIFNSLHKNEQVQDPISLLSDREMEIAEKLVKGMGIKEISNAMNLHASTISTYKNRVFVKLDLQSIPELIEVFRFHGLLTS